MPKPRAGYHDLVTQIPEVLWVRLEADATARGASLTRTLVLILQKHYKVPDADLPKPRRAGRPRKPREGTT